MAPISTDSPLLKQPRLELTLGVLSGSTLTSTKNSLLSFSTENKLLNSDKLTTRNASASGSAKLLTSSAGKRVDLLASTPTGRKLVSNQLLLSAKLLQSSPPLACPTIITQHDHIPSTLLNKSEDTCNNACNNIEAATTVPAEWRETAEDNILDSFPAHLRTEENEESDESPAFVLEDRKNLITPAEDKRSAFASHSLSTKEAFMNAISGALVSSPNYNNANNVQRQELLAMASEVVGCEPEFLLKCALYTRRDLNIRTASNLLLAYAATLPECRPFLKKYFGASIRLPTDWIDVADLYSTLEDNRSAKGRCSLPVALRKAMTEKFADFDVFQLAKYNKEKRVKKEKGTKKNKDADDSNTENGGRSSEPQTVPPNLKRLIRQLHISRPAEVVMSLTGKRYPANSIEFRKSGLLGIWEEERADKRMHLPIPETWETQVAKRGNKAEVWEQLLDNKKLPFMAMLRNLRNMIKTGISPRHHNNVLHRLEDERSVIASKQFPFRFLAAYEVLDQLKTDLTKASDIKTKLASSKVTLKSKKGKRGEKKETPKERAAKRARLEKRSQLKYDEALLTRYQKALDTALKISTLHNIQPISGRTVVVCNIGTDRVMSAPCTSARGLGKPRTAREVAALLGLMFKYACEDCQLLAYDGTTLVPVTKLDKGTILDNVKVLLNEPFESGLKLKAKLQEYAVDRIKIDNLLTIGNCARQSADDEAITAFFKRYRSTVNSDALYINVNLAPGGQADNRTETPAEDKSVYLRGFSDQLLRFVAERGNAGLLTYVDNIDKTYELGVSVVGQMSARRQQQLLSNIYPSMDALRTDRFLTVRPVRIFISSTFHDMHGERDELVRSVFPHLQRELSKKTNGTLKICPIDLRWGVSVDHVSNQSALEQCLIEVTKCDLFVGVFGARYGWIPSKEQLLHAIKRNPLLSWLDDPKILASELSVTALEVMTFLKQFGSERALFFLRQADYSRIAEDKRSLFIESTEGMQRVAKLKKYISDSAPQHVHNYRTTGWIHSKGRTLCSGLEEFSNAVATQLLNACQPFVSRCLESKAINENDFVRNWRTVEEKAGCFTSAAVLGHVQSLLNKPSNKLVVLAGESGCGKTSLAADVAIVERNRQRSAVIPFFAFTKSLSSVQVIDYLTSVIDKIAIELTIEPRSNIVETMADIAKIGGRMVFVFDGLDTCQSLNSIIADFVDIANVTIVMTTSLNSAVCQLATKLGCTLVQIPGLPLAARKTMVRKELAEFGKRLGESAFDSQIRSFVSKRHADKPTYIKLACHYLRLFAYFDNIGTMITKLPSTIESLVREIVKQLELNCGKDLVGSLLGYLLVSPSPLTEGDLHVLASTAAAQNNSNEEFSSLLPRNHFQRTFDLMQILLNEDADGNLILINNATSDVVAKTYFKVPATKKAMLSSLADFCGRMLETASVEDFARYASISMNCRIMTADWIQLHDLLCRIENLEKSIESNMIDAFEVFADAAIEGLDTASKKTKSKNAWSIPIKDLRAVKRFIGEKKEFLKRYPKLLIQEVANYPQSSGVQEILYSNSMTDPVIQWQNKPDQASKCLRTVKYGDTAVTAATVSLNGAVLAFGDEEGLVRIVKYNSAEMVHSFSGHSQRVTDMCFTDSVGQTLVSASADSSLMVWDTVACARLATLHHGDSVVSACRYFEWSKCVLSAGWNGMVRAFAPVMGQWKTASVLDRELSVGSAINCLDCHPTRPVIVVGCWDATLKLYQLAPVKRLAVMRGHVSAVRTAQFVAMGKQIISTGMDGDIRVWATDHGVQVGMFAGHTLPVRAMIPLANDIVTVSEDTTIKVWSSSLGVPLFRQSTDDKATSISLSVDGGLLAVGFGSGVISVFKTQSTDRCVWSHHVDSAVASVRFFGQLIVVAYKSGGQIFRATNGERVAQLATGDPDLMCADAGGGSIVTGHASGALKVFEASMIVGLKHNKTTLQSWTEKFEHEDAVTCCALSPKALRLATVGRDKKLVIWEMNELLERKKDSCVQSVVRQCHNDWVLSCAWSDGGNSLVVTGGLDCAVKVWDADKQCALIATFTHHSAAILSLAFQKKVIASTDSDGTVCVVSAKGGALVTRIKPVTNGPMPVACALRIGNSTNDDASQLNPDDKIDWAAEMDAALESGRGDSSTVAADSQNSLLRDSQLAVAFDSGSFQVYNPFMGDEKTCATGHSAPVLCVASAANGTGDSFVTGDKNGLCKWWGEMSLESETTTRLSGVVTAMIVDTNCVIAGCRDGSLYVMDSNGSKMSSWKAHTRTVTGLVNLPNGQLASVSEDQTVAIWTRKGKIWDGSEVSRTQFDTPITCAVFTDQLLVATWNNKIHSLDLRSQAISLFVRSSSSAYIERSVPCHQGSAVFLSSEGNVAGELLTDEWEKKSVLLLRGASCAVELHQDLWIVGTKLGEIVACGGGESAVSTPLCKAHDGDIIGIVAIPDCEGKPSTLCSVSKDCSVKIWQLEQDGKIALKLIGCWMAPVEPNYVIFCETSGEIWIGDMVGSIYRLKFDAM